MYKQEFGFLVLAISSLVSQSVRPQALGEPEPGEPSEDVFSNLTSVGNGAKKNAEILMVIDVQDGYDADVIAQTSGPGGLSYINAEHDVAQAVNLKTKEVLTTFAPGAVKIKYDKVWNRGLPHKLFEKVVQRVVQEIDKKQWDLIVFTHDYLDPEATGVFRLENNGRWPDEKGNGFALVPYGEYLTLTANGAGKDVHHELLEGAHLNMKCSDKSSWMNGAAGKNILCLRKQVDDAFNDDMDGAMMKNVDVDDAGKRREGSKSLLQQLTEMGFGPGQATLTFTGVVTNRCVKSSLVTSCKAGYQTKVLTGGTAAVTDGEHEMGLEEMMKECPTVEIAD